MLTFCELFFFVFYILYEFRGWHAKRFRELSKRGEGDLSMRFSEYPPDRRE